MDSDHMMNLKKNLKYLMSKHRLSLVDISAKTGIPKQTLHNWISGVDPKNISQVRRLGTHFKLTVDELCFGDVSQSKAASHDTWEAYQDEIRAGTFEVILRPIKRH